MPPPIATVHSDQCETLVQDALNWSPQHTFKTEFQEHNF